MPELSNRIKNILKRFSAATIRAAMAENPAVMQASGWDYDKDNELYQGDPNNPGAKELRKSLAVLGIGTTAATGAATLIPTAPAALGNVIANASSYLQPSKYIDSAVKLAGSAAGRGLGASSYYTGASTLPGVIADTAADSYFAADAVRRMRNSDSPKDVVMGTLDLAPLAAPLSKASRLVGHGLGNIDAYKDLVRDDNFVINKAYDGFDYAKDKYIRRGDHLRGRAESSYSSVPKEAYNSATLIDADSHPYFTIENKLFDDNGWAKKHEIMLNKGSVSHLRTAYKEDPREALHQLQGDAAHEGTHWALMHFHDNLSVPSGNYYVANPKHPLYADYTSWFDTQKKEWLRSPEEFVAELTASQYLNGVPTDRSYNTMSASERLPIVRDLSGMWKGATNNGIDRMIKGLSDYGYANGGRFFRASSPEEVVSSEPEVPLVSYMPSVILPSEVTDSVVSAIPESAGAVSYPVETVKPSDPIQIQGIPLEYPALDMSDFVPSLDYAGMKMRQRYAESGFRDNLTSKAGAKGRYQIMPITLQEYTERTGKTGDLMDAVFNEGIRDWYMDTRLPQFSVMKRGNPTDLIREYRRYAAYNMGPGALNKALTKAEKEGVDIDNTTDWVSYLPKETRDYVNFIVGGQDIADTSKTRLLYEAAKRLKGVKEDGGFLRDYKSGGKIHIKPSHRGRLTELKKRTGKSEAELYNDGNPAHKKMVVFARNSRKWKKADGGYLDIPDTVSNEDLLAIIQKIKTK